jgi:triphosphoribosyl-dephospho-CoA synthase CitG
MRTFFHTRYADKIARLAVRAMLYEVTAAPKPGLVDRENSGSHRDMDIFPVLDGLRMTGLDSSAALAAHFRDFTLKGLAFEGTAEQLFDAIRYTGLLAEDSMFAATNGANTHKGLIFSLGVLCAALGYLRGRDMPGETDRLFSLCAQMTAKLKADFAGVTAENARTAGEKIYARYGVTGIRGEAASGFASVRAYGLPPFRALTSQGYSLNDAGVITLLHLMANAQDTNIIARSDLETQKEVQREARDLLSRTGRSPRALLQEIRGLDKSFIGRNISPGGSADLLAVTYFIYFLENDA